MKKLAQLKPDRRTIYMDGGKGQEVDYLYISPEKLNMEALKSDVKAGAVQYQELLQFAEKKPARVVLIDCANEEEGLMAVSYLAGIYNGKDDVYGDMLEKFGYDADEDEPWDTSDESKEFELSDFEMGEGVDMDDEDEGLMDMSRWEESPCRLPVVPLFKLIQYSNNAHSVFQEDNFFTAGDRNQRNNEPYWLTARREPICITTTVGFYGMGFGCDNALVTELKRFAQNRHVYVLVVDEHKNAQKEEDIPADDLEESFLEGSGTRKQEIFCEIALEYTAAIVEVYSKEEEKKKYYQVLFENWAHEFGKKLEKRFPKGTLVEQITAMRSPDKSALIEKVYRYVLSEGEKGDILTKEDFAILKKFRALGTVADKKEEKRSVEKMEKSLVGMEAVKKQVYSIVDVMKYNKKRAAMGLGDGGYHNVHLLIGAPGTAKTTVAQMLGDIMCEQRLLPGNRFISINGADLKGLYVGHSAPKTHRYFEEYDVILIDEAYSLTSEKDMDSFSQEAIAQLIIELEKHGLDKLVMFAGYGGMHVKEEDNKMKQFLKANPGIRSRINSTIFFDSYTPEEMLQIVHRQAQNQKYHLTHEADELIKNYFAERVQDADFGNGREARSLLENITMKAAMRTMRLSDSQITKKNLQELSLDDVKEAIKQQQESYLNQKGQQRKKLGFM